MRTVNLLYVHDGTGIALAAIDGHPVADMSPEDLQAFLLLRSAGLFDVHGEVAPGESA